MSIYEIWFTFITLVTVTAYIGVSHAPISL
jgi:hypothetical protein